MGIFLRALAVSTFAAIPACRTMGEPALGQAQMWSHPAEPDTLQFAMHGHCSSTEDARERTATTLFNYCRSQGADTFVVDAFDPVVCEAGTFRARLRGYCAVLTR